MVDPKHDADIDYQPVGTPTNQTEYAAKADVSPFVSEASSPSEYFRTRISTLKPPMTKVENPIKLLGLLNKQQWMFFLVAFAGWTWDGFDFFTVSMTVSDLAKDFGRSNTDITWGISLVLMFRSVGSITFGLASDRWGRKWPFVVNNILFIVLELLTGFCTTYEQFLVVRALFGVAMGGLYGNAAATALEDCPPAARGLLSGIFQQGYPFGYLLAVVFARVFVNTTSHGWRPLYWFGACPPILIIIFRLCLPETKVYQQRQLVMASSENASKAFWEEGKVVMRRHWLLLMYMVTLMGAISFMSHGSQDLYPTMLKNQLQFTPDQVTVTQVIANLGAITGGAVVGYYSQVFGRRLSIIAMCILGAALLYPYGFVKNDGVVAVSFFEQFAVQGALGVIPIHLMELSPPSYSTFIVGTSYQLGTLIASASSTIESSLGESFPLPPKDGVDRFEYGYVICIFMAIVFTTVLLLMLIGPENRNKEFDVAHDDDVEQAMHLGHGDIDRILRDSEKDEGRKTPTGYA